ncbi:MAG: MBL fold metallo-hydrolase [Marinifilaceae bacterium]
MKITFLGTGTSQGVPVVACKCPVCQSINSKDKRLRTSAMVEINGQNLIIDCGPDFRYQMLRENVENIRAILFTHEHRDHVAGLDDVRSFNWVNKAPVSIYAEERVVTCLENMFSYAFDKIENYPGTPEINVNIINENPFKIDDIEIIPIRGMHYQLPVLGFRIGDLTYITDFNKIADQEIEKIKGSKVLVINALRREKHISHFSLDEALEVINKAKPVKAFITHIGHQLNKHDIEEYKLPDNVFFAFDTLAVEV